MQRITLILFFLFALIKSPSHAQNLDSLLSIWNDKTQTDSIRVQAYSNYIKKGYLVNKPDSAIIIAEKLHEYAQKHSYPKASAIGDILQGFANYIMGNNVKALEHYQKSLNIRTQLGDKNGMASALINLGIVYNDLGNSTKALDCYERSLTIFQDTGDSSGIANNLNNIGRIYFEQKNYERAMEYYNKCLEIQKKIRSDNGISNSLNNIGQIYEAKGDYTKALEFYENSLSIREKIQFKLGISGSLYDIAQIYFKQNQYTEALEYNKKSLAIREEIGDKKGIASNLSSMGNIYLKQGKAALALENCHESLDLSEETGILADQKTACECLYNAYKSLGKGNDALVYMEKMQVIEDSMHAQETTKKLEQMEFAKVLLQDSIAKAEEVRQIEEAHLQEVRRKNQTRNILIGSSAFLLLLAFGLYSRWRYTRRSRDLISKEKDRSENLLLNILPAEIAQELKETGRAEARDFDMVSILFTDFKGFTEASAKLSATELVQEINYCFEAFDAIMVKYGIEKIKTIGDAYMAAGGLPVPTEHSVKNTVLAALEMQQFILQRKVQNDTEGKPAFEMRVGIHTGPVVAGIVGVKKFQYDIWGDTVNTASRMESMGEVGKVNVSDSTYQALKNEPDLAFKSRGKIEVKGKGEVEMWFVEKRN